MLWYHTWAHYDMVHIQTLLVTPNYPNLTQLIQPKHVKASSYPNPKCVTCCLSKTGRYSVPATQILDTSKHNLNDATIKRGDMVDLDQYMSVLPSRLPTTFGKEKPKKKYTGGTIFIDGKTGFIHHHHQVYLRAGETLQGKNGFDNESGKFNVKIKSF
jgi:hypothetical protein